MVASVTDFLDQIEGLFGSALVPQAGQSLQAFDLFEVFVLGLVLEAARQEQATVRLVNHAGNPVGRYLFRSGPGTLGRPTKDFTHAEIEFIGHNPLEAHVGIKVTGRAEIDHECDVVVLLKTEAELARSWRGSPRYGKLLLHVECKYYLAGIDVGEGRNFLGLRVDLRRRCDGFFVMNRKSVNVEKLLQIHGLAVAPRVDPGNDDHIQRLVGYLRRPFQRYAATGKV